MKKLVFLLVFIFPALGFAQDVSEVKVKVGGFVKNDMFWDSRQTISAREGHFLLFPAPEKLDSDGQDINCAANFNFLSIQSRLGVTITGAHLLNADVSAKIEGDFFGQLNPNINLFRLRHAFIKMKWTNTELLVGQYWIPMFVTDCFPGTISFNTGTPFQPFGRNPQIRLSQTLGPAKLILIANSQRDYSSRGPNPVAPSTTLTSGVFLRNAVIPEFSLQAHVKAGEAVLFGLGASYKQIVPQISTPLGYATDESVGGYNAFAFLRIKTNPITFKAQGIYGQNIPDVLSIGGIAISDSTDASRGFVKYTTLNAMSAWMDLSTNGKKVQVGLFAGFSKNLGAKDKVVGPIYGLGTSIESMYRVSPRISYSISKLRFALEGEYTNASYGATYDEYGVPQDLTPVGNFRILFASYFFF